MPDRDRSDLAFVRHNHVATIDPRQGVIWSTPFPFIWRAGYDACLADNPPANVEVVQAFRNAITALGGEITDNPDGTVSISLSRVETYMRNLEDLERLVSRDLGAEIDYSPDGRIAAIHIPERSLPVGAYTVGVLTEYIRKHGGVIETVNDQVVGIDWKNCIGGEELP